MYENEEGKDFRITLKIFALLEIQEMGRSGHTGCVECVRRIS